MRWITGPSPTDRDYLKNAESQHLIGWICPNFTYEIGIFCNPGFDWVLVFNVVFIIQIPFDKLIFYYLLNNVLRKHLSGSLDLIFVSFKTSKIKGLRFSFLKLISPSIHKSILSIKYKFCKYSTKILNNNFCFLYKKLILIYFISIYYKYLITRLYKDNKRNLFKIRYSFYNNLFERC
jgi:hypothetical protein